MSEREAQERKGGGEGAERPGGGEKKAMFPNPRE
jgi:hypothetical protein